MRLSRKICLLSAVAWGLGAGVPAQARHAATASDLADEQARQVLAHMSLQDKMALLFSVDGGGFNGSVAPPGGLGSAAYLRAPPGSGLPDLQISDAGVGVRNPAHIRPMARRSPCHPVWPQPVVGIWTWPGRRAR